MKHMVEEFGWSVCLIILGGLAIGGLYGVLEFVCG